MLIARYQDSGEVRFGVVDGAALTLRPFDAGRFSGAAAIAAIGSAALGDIDGRNEPDLALEEPLPLTSLRLLAPVPQPRKIICLGRNYAAHASEENVELPAYPEVFSKWATTITNPGDPIQLPPEDPAIDYEAELCVVIGRRARRVAPEAALKQVAGYTVANDISARTYQHRVLQWTTGKNFDTFCPLGPFLATPGSIADPHNLTLQCRIAGEVLQHASTGDMIFRIPDIIAYLSNVMTLEPGDLILTGTPSGIGHARNPKRYLQAGETVETEISEIGILSNPVVRG